jgi:hypothetical protein
MLVKMYYLARTRARPRLRHILSISHVNQTSAAANSRTPMIANTNSMFQQVQAWHVCSQLLHQHSGCRRSSNKQERQEVQNKLSEYNRFSSGLKKRPLISPHTTPTCAHLPTCTGSKMRHVVHANYCTNTRYSAACRQIEAMFTQCSCHCRDYVSIATVIAVVIHARASNAAALLWLLNALAFCASCTLAQTRSAHLLEQRQQQMFASARVLVRLHLAQE